MGSLRGDHEDPWLARRACGVDGRRVSTGHRDGGAVNPGDNVTGWAVDVHHLERRPTRKPHDRTTVVPTARATSPEQHLLHHTRPSPQIYLSESATEPLQWNDCHIRTQQLRLYGGKVVAFVLKNERRSRRSGLN
jgi:hypothetical protein